VLSLGKKLTPEARSELVEKANRQARKTYRKTTKRRNLSPDELQTVKDIVVPLKVVGYSNLQIGLVTGISKSQISEITKDEKIQERIAKLRTGLPKAAQDLMRVYMIEAVMAIVHVMRTAKSNGDILKAAAEILDRTDMPKTSRAEQTNKFGEDPTPESEKELFDQLRSADPEIQERAAQLRDAFEDGLKTLMMQSEGKAESEAPG
jgi:hypothetical protein